MMPKRMLVVDSVEFDLHRKILEEFEGDFIITYSNRTGLMTIPEGYDIYVINTLDVDADAIWKLKKQQPQCSIYGINGGLERKGKTLDVSITNCVRAVYGYFENKLVELIYADVEKAEEEG